ncbi:uncharacterized protein LOC101457186 [Ceratitis capitata]|uniref:uncharacterized protein LOC101457186 n=1 Tax=Ceratitis capitata TaxID=7213 RepID=UPI00032A28A2|nr:uncharacterized protein LOC101457186 [Ceratitis capitata]
MPGNSCTLCKSSWDNTISMFALPSDKYLRKEWEAACGIKLAPSSRICAKHFVVKDFVKNNPKRTRLQPDAVPSLNLSIKRKEANNMLFNSNNSYRKNRASLGQLVYFVNFAKMEPKILTSKFSTVKHLWEDLAQHLNELDGASRTPLKWKETMATWRCQLRCRARRGKSSGVPEFDEFALYNFGQQSMDELNETAHNSTSTEFDAQDSNDRNDENNDSIEADVTIKAEVDYSDEEVSATLHNLPGSCVTEVDPQAEAITGVEDEIDIKPDIDNEKVHEATNSGSTTKIQTLGFPRSSRSKIFFIPRHGINSENNTTEDFAEPKNLKRKIDSEISAKDGASKVVVIGESANSAENLPQNFDPDTRINGINQSVATTSTSNEFQNSRSCAPSSASKVLERGETPLCLDNLSQSASGSSPTAQMPESSTTECKTTTLQEVYETVLASIRRRDERDEQFSNVIQELAGAVTRMADNIKQLEEVLTFCANN